MNKTNYCKVLNFLTKFISEKKHCTADIM